MHLLVKAARGQPGALGNLGWLHSRERAGRAKRKGNNKSQEA